MIVHSIHSPQISTKSLQKNTTKKAQNSSHNVPNFSYNALDYLSAKNYSNIRFGNKFTEGLYERDIYGQELMNYDECQNVAKKLGIKNFDIQNQETANYILDGLNLLRLKTNGNIVMPKEVKFVSPEEVNNKIMQFNLTDVDKDNYNYNLLLNKDFFNMENLAFKLYSINNFYNSKGEQQEILTFLPPRYLESIDTSLSILNSSQNLNGSALTCALKSYIVYEYAQHAYQAAKELPEMFYVNALKEAFKYKLSPFTYPESTLEHYAFIKSHDFEKEIDEAGYIRACSDKEKKYFLAKKRNDAFFQSLKVLRRACFDKKLDFNLPMPLPDEYTPLYEIIGAANYMVKNQNKKDSSSYFRNEKEFYNNNEIKDFAIFHRNSRSPRELAGVLLDYYMKDFKTPSGCEKLKKLLIQQYNLTTLFEHKKTAI